MGIARSLIVAVVMLGVAPAAAGPLEDGKAAWERKDYATALADLQPLADQGAARAQAMIGLMNMAGQGVPYNFAEAAKWFRKAADQDDGFAQTSLAMLYKRGAGVAQDNVQAYFWLTLAASHFSAEDARVFVRNSRDPVSVRMTPAQIAEAERLAAQWKPVK
jgi:TPR repeat protein